MNHLLFCCLLFLSAIFAQAQNIFEDYSPFKKDAYLTSSFGENRGTRYHAGIDYSTQMEEGLAIFAPENGSVQELRVSPYGYGKVMFFLGESGKTWVFAHQSSFGKLDSLIEEKQFSSKKNDVSIKPHVAYKKGDTLSFAGSSGIGNPHLHLEVRLDKDKIVSPCAIGAACTDTIAPQVFAAAVWQNNDLAITGGESFEQGCFETPTLNKEPINLAIKIADYSREPKENPMSIRRLELREGEKILFSQNYDTLSYKNMLNIRNELLWAEEADTAGDWHFVNTKIYSSSQYRLFIEDFAGHTTVKRFLFRYNCKNNKPPQLTKYQTAPVFSFLSRSAIDLSKCDSGETFIAKDKKGNIISSNICTEFPHQVLFLGKIIEKYPKMTNLINNNNNIALFNFNSKQNQVSWNLTMDSVAISQKISKIKPLNTKENRVLAVSRTHTDSLDFYEFHPKGIQFHGKWDVCLDPKKISAPLYWLGETSRNWFIFSKQKGTKKRCVSINELRDLAFINNTEAPKLETPYWSSSIINGTPKAVLRIPVIYKYDGFSNGNSISAYANEKWIPIEFDSEPREIVINAAYLEQNKNVKIELEDEAYHKASYNVSIPQKP